jgi:HEAT repeat protein
VHAEAETKALKDAGAQLKGKDEAPRIQALESVAALAKSHQNAPSAAAAKVLGAGLKDPSFTVRAKAAALLASGQDHDTAAQAIADAVKSLREDGTKVLVPAGMNGMTAEQTAFSAYMKALVEAVVTVHDERAASALVEFLKKAPTIAPEEMMLPVVSAAGELKTAPAMEVVIGRLQASEAFGGSRAYHDVLVKAAKARGGTDIPEWGATPSARWKKWLAANRKLFPGKLDA